MEPGKECFASVRVQLDVLVGSDPPLRDRVRSTTAMLSVSATCMFFCSRWTTGTSSVPSSWRWPPT